MKWLAGLFIELAGVSLADVNAATALLLLAAGAMIMFSSLQERKH